MQKRGTTIINNIERMNNKNLNILILTANPTIYFQNQVKHNKNKRKDPGENTNNYDKPIIPTCKLEERTWMRLLGVTFT